MLDYLEESGQLDNTLIVVVSDNGASAEGGPNGTFNEWEFFNGIPSTTERNLPHFDELGTPASNNHYCTGWAWAFDTPFPYWKRWAGYEGGVTDMMLVSWPAKIARLEGDPPPVHARGRRRADGLRPARDRAARDDQGLPPAPDRGRELRRRAHRRDGAGQGDAVLRDARAALDLPRGLAGLHGAPAARGLGQRSRRTSGSCTTSRPTGRSRRTWPADEPDRLEMMKGLWFYYAGIYNGLPLDDRSALEQVLAERPRGAPVRDQYVFYPGTADVPESAGPAIPGRSYTLSAGVTIDSVDAEGVIWAAGGVAGGHSLYVKDRRLRYTFNWVGSLLPGRRGDDRPHAGRPRAHGGVLRREALEPTPSARAPRARSRSTSTTRRSAGRDHHPARVLLPDG